MKHRVAWWRVNCGAAVVLSLLTFTPLVLAPGHHTPELFGIPRTLWLGILIAFALVAVTFVGGLMHPENESDASDSGEDRC